jgi:hypothetical protein
MAICLTLGINAGLSSAVSAYFTKFKILPPKSLAVSQTKTLTGANSFETLLNGILAEKTTTDFVIVVHGHETGNGLFLKLVTRDSTGAGFETTGEMLQIIMDVSARNPATATTEEKAKLQLTDAEITRLIGLMSKVRDKKLNLVEFRGCNLGKNASSLTRFRAFLGATTFGAPNLHSFFGKFPAKSGAQIMKDHTQSHASNTEMYPSSLGGKNSAICIGLNDQKKPENGHIVADDATTMDLWIKANLDASNSLGKDTTLAIHGLWEFRKPPAGDPSGIDPPPRPIFPLAVATDGPNKGKNEYALHVIYKT